MAMGLSPLWSCMVMVLSFVGIGVGLLGRRGGSNHQHSYAHGDCHLSWFMVMHGLGFVFGRGAEVDADAAVLGSAMQSMLSWY